MIYLELPYVCTKFLFYICVDVAIVKELLLVAGVLTRDGAWELVNCVVTNEVGSPEKEIMYNYLALKFLFHHIPCVQRQTVVFQSDLCVLMQCNFNDYA